MGSVKVPAHLVPAVVRSPRPHVRPPATADIKPKPSARPSVIPAGVSNDPFEHEADRVAQRVLRTGNGVSAGRHVRRASASTTPISKVANDYSPIVGEAIKSGGQPLAADTRAFFEPRFRADFSDVRLHADTRAARSADAIGAEAYTVGNHIVLGSDHAPSDPGTRPVLAHELTHVVQQGAPTARATSPVQRFTAPTVQRAMKKGCLAPSLVVDVATASAFGTVAETLIEADYITQTGGIPFGDVFLDNPLGPMAYIAFLAVHHPSIDKTRLALQVSLSGGVLVPDILDTRTSEFYDVKPDSPDGRIAGRAKLSAIDAFMSFNKLPYARGTSYTPTPSIPIPLSSAALMTALTLIGGATTAVPALACGLPIVTLAPRRSAAGLLVYEICVEADLDCYLKVLTIEALIAAVIVAAIVTRGASIPATARALPILAPLL